MVGILVSFWDGLFSGTYFQGGHIYIHYMYIYIYIESHTDGLTFSHLEASKDWSQNPTFPIEDWSGIACQRTRIVGFSAPCHWKILGVFPTKNPSKLHKLATFSFEKCYSTHKCTLMLMSALIFWYWNYACSTMKIHRIFLVIDGWHPHPRATFTRFLRPWEITDPRTSEVCWHWWTWWILLHGADANY